MNRLMIVVGTALVALGVAWPLVKRLPLFRLPGDVLIDRPGLKVFVPITTMLVISIVMSLVAWLMRR
ncbi:MAG: DUF2905 domain-containing protein [Proteobacteria bacterium]|nr:MAG: DUF2905 domain-containing protein [Pseudomonadota bacterium]